MNTVLYINNINNDASTIIVSLHNDAVEYFKEKKYTQALTNFQQVLTSSLEGGEHGKHLNTNASLPDISPREKLTKDLMELKASAYRYSFVHSGGNQISRMHLRFDEGFNTLKETLDIDKTSYKDTSLTCYNLAKTKECMGDYNGALRFYIEALTGAESRFVKRSDDFLLVTTLRSIGQVCYLQGNLEDSLSAYSMANSIYKEYIPVKDNLVSTSILCCMVALNYHMHFSDGTGLDTKQLEESLRMMRLFLDHNHIDIATVQNNLGRSYLKQGKFKEACSSLVEALRIRHKQMGHCHQDVAATYYYLGEVYYKTLFKNDAANYYSGFLRIAEKLNILYYPEVAEVYHHLGDIYLNKDKHSALTNYKKALDIESRLYNPEHPHVLRTLNKLGTIFTETADYQSAKNVYKGILVIQMKVHGLSSTKIIPPLTKIAQVYEQLKDYEESICAYQQVLFIQQGVQEDNVVTDIWSTLINIGLLQKQKGDLHEALSTFREALQLKENVGNTIKDIQMIPVLNELIDILIQQNLLEQAADCDMQLMEIENSCDKLDCYLHDQRLRNIGSLYRDCQKYEKALGCFRKAYEFKSHQIEVERANEGIEHDISEYQILIMILYDIGEMYLMLSDRDAAKYHFMKALHQANHIDNDDKAFEAFLLGKIENSYRQARIQIFGEVSKRSTTGAPAA